MEERPGSEAAMEIVDHDAEVALKMSAHAQAPDAEVTIAKQIPQGLANVKFDLFKQAP